MYNPALSTFITVADSGSFTKAAEQLYISPTAVMKQMNTLERHLDVKLIERTTSGVRLTDAGESLYRSAKFIIDYSKKALASAKEAELYYETTFCVGNSLLNPAKPFMELWYKLKDKFPGYKLHLVPFDDDHTGIISEIRSLGEKFDFLIGVNDSEKWNSICKFQPVGRYKKMIAVSREHPLAARESIDVSDLAGETLMMVPRGDSPTNDAIRDELEKKHPEIHIENTSQFFDLSVFNRCAETGKVLLINECWRDVHPGLVVIPVNWGYSIPYGLLYSNDAPADVLRFAEEVKNLSQT